MALKRARAPLLAAAILAPALASCAFGVDSPVSPILPVHAALEEPRPGPVESVFARPSLVVEKVEGAEPAPLHAAFASVIPRVRKCFPGVGLDGMLQLKLDVREGRVHYAVMSDPNPAESLMRRCVLETLSTVDVDGIWSQGSPSERPPGFTAHLRIQW